MRRRPPLQSEIVVRLHQAFAEILLPDAIDDHPSGERIVLPNDPFRQIEAIRAAICFRNGRQDRRRTRFDDIGRPGEVALDEYRRLARRLAFLPSPSSSGRLSRPSQMPRIRSLMPGTFPPIDPAPKRRVVVAGRISASPPACRALCEDWQRCAFRFEGLSPFSQATISAALLFRCASIELLNFVEPRVPRCFNIDAGVANFQSRLVLHR